jgi:TrmH family RNA methyltransferase
VGSTPSATAARRRASSAACGSSASTPGCRRTTSATAGSSPACTPRASRSTARSSPTWPSRPRRLHGTGAGRQGGSLSDQLTFTNPKVQRLRRLLGRRSARLDEGAFVVEGPSLVAAAHTAGWEIEAQFVAPGEPTTCPRGRAGVRARAERDREGRLHRHTTGRCSRSSPAFVLLAVSPGRRSSWSATGSAIRATPAPSCVRRRPPEPTPWCSQRLGRRVQPEGRARVGGRAVPRPGRHRRARWPTSSAAAVTRAGHVVAPGRAPYTDTDLTGPVALVVGNEAHGLPDDAPVDGWLTIPHAGRAESLNVAMAATVLVFEVARQAVGGTGASSAPAVTDSRAMWKRRSDFGAPGSRPGWPHAVDTDLA